MENTENKLQKSENLLLDVFEYFPSFICTVHTKDDIIVYANHNTRLIFGNDTVGCKYADVFGKECELDTTAERHSIEYEKCIHDKWYHIIDSKVTWLDDEPARIIFGTDITKIKNSERKLSLDAKLDLMTGIYNRQAGKDFLGQYVQEVKYFGLICTICYMYLNDLKFVNDNFGHRAGDEYIMAVVSSIKSSIRRTDIFARMGGDEFLLIFPNCRYDIVENIMSIVNNKLELVSVTNQMPYSVSYGIMEVNSETPSDLDYIFNAVDSKMYYMKEIYRKNRKLPDLKNEIKD